MKSFLNLYFELKNMWNLIRQNRIIDDREKIKVPLI